MEAGVSKLRLLLLGLVWMLASSAMGGDQLYGLGSVWNRYYDIGHTIYIVHDAVIIFCEFGVMEKRLDFVCVLDIVIFYWSNQMMMLSIDECNHYGLSYIWNNGNKMILVYRKYNRIFRCLDHFGNEFDLVKNWESTYILICLLLLILLKNNVF